MIEWVIEWRMWWSKRNKNNTVPNNMPLYRTRSLPVPFRTVRTLSTSIVLWLTFHTSHFRFSFHHPSSIIHHPSFHHPRPSYYEYEYRAVSYSSNHAYYSSVHIHATLQQLLWWQHSVTSSLPTTIRLFSFWSIRWLSSAWYMHSLHHTSICLLLVVVFRRS